MRMKVQLHESNQKMKVNFGQVQMSGGENGVSPIVDLTETDTGVDITVTDAEGVKRATVRNGRDGEDGHTPEKGKDYFDGQDGFSPIVAVQDISGGHRVTITDKDGAKAFDVLDGKDAEGGGGASVQADWAVNDESDPAYVKNRPFYSYTPPPIVMYTQGTDNADSFDASALGLGVFVKIYDEPLSNDYMTILQNEQLSEWYGNIADRNDGNFKVGDRLLGEDGIGHVFACDAFAEGSHNVYLANFETAIDLTGVYGIIIPSAGVYLCIPSENVNIERIEMRHLEVRKKLPAKYRQTIIRVEMHRVPIYDGDDEVIALTYDEWYQMEAIEEKLHEENTVFLDVYAGSTNFFVQMYRESSGYFGGKYIDFTNTRLTIHEFTLDNDLRVKWRAKTFNLS